MRGKKTVILPVDTSMATAQYVNALGTRRYALLAELNAIDKIAKLLDRADVGAFGIRHKRKPKPIAKKARKTRASNRTVHGKRKLLGGRKSMLQDKVAKALSPSVPRSAKEIGKAVGRPMEQTYPPLGALVSRRIAKEVKHDGRKAWILTGRDEVAANA